MDVKQLYVPRYNSNRNNQDHQVHFFLQPNQDIQDNARHGLPAGLPQPPEQPLTKCVQAQLEGAELAKHIHPSVVLLPHGYEHQRVHRSGVGIPQQKPPQPHPFQGGAPWDGEGAQRGKEVEGAGQEVQKEQVTTALQGQVSALQCPTCGKHSKAKKRLTAHLKTHIIRKCPKCGNNVSEAGWKDHMVKHQPERNFVCKSCKTSFKRNRELKTHKANCKNCPANIIVRGNL
jgi:predicted RNA-binding Zn-ribbon protein involved in translation (DUF1610 family)